MRDRRLDRLVHETDKELRHRLGTHVVPLALAKEREYVAQLVSELRARAEKAETERDRAEDWKRELEARRRDNLKLMGERDIARLESAHARAAAGFAP